LSVVLHDGGGVVRVTSAAVHSLVVQAAESVDGARVRRQRRHLEIEVGRGRARVELELAVRYGAVMPEVGREVQRRIADALHTMLGLDADAIDVSIEELES
jgi:uncharacterized alkaline shock family protein YloU